MKSRTLVILVISAILVVAFTFHSINNRKKAEWLEKYDKAATIFDTSGIMAHDDYIQLARLTDDGKDHGLSDNDVQWFIEQLHKSKDPVVRAMLMDSLTQVKVLSASQKDIVYQATNQYLAGPDKLDKKYACVVMQTLHDKRSIPALQKLLSDSDPSVVRIANRILASVSAP